MHESKALNTISHRSPMLLFFSSLLLLAGPIPAQAEETSTKTLDQADGKAPRATVGTADEQDTGLLGDYPPEAHYHPTPKWWMVELKFGPYKPNVDAEPGLAGRPYMDVFGCGPGKDCSTWSGYDVMSQLEVDFQFWQPHGSLAVGLTTGYFRISGHSLVPEDPSLPYDPDSNPYVPSGDKTTMNLVPLVLQLVYRWDYMALHWGVPLVPYVKAGGVYTFWWIENGDGDTAKFGNGDKAYGGTFGYQINLGLALLLDPLEPSAAKVMDAELGVNHTYLFCEFAHSQVRWSFTGERMRLGMPATFYAGLAMEF